MTTESWRSRARGGSPSGASAPCQGWVPLHPWGRGYQLICGSTVSDITPPGYWLDAVAYPLGQRRGSELSVGLFVCGSNVSDITPPRFQGWWATQLWPPACRVAKPHQVLWPQACLGMLSLGQAVERVLTRSFGRAPHRAAAERSAALAVRRRSRTRTGDTPSVVLRGPCHGRRVVRLAPRGAPAPWLGLTRARAVLRGQGSARRRQRWGRAGRGILRTCGGAPLRPRRASGGLRPWFPSSVGASVSWPRLAAA